ncbi:MAG: hypothetical protein Q8Q57_11810 [Methylotenera sp.]|nr:hypothetical protein [Methylotenera sp.]
MKNEITDDEIITAFANSNFGERIQSAEQKRLYLRCAVMKAAMGYGSGFTITKIMKELKLLNKTGLPNSKGRYLLCGLYDQLAYKP